MITHASNIAGQIDTMKNTLFDPDLQNQTFAPFKQSML